ncbi:MAG: metallophosphoesterase [Planctomycetaceae bacterium]|nr:metallophosphoesterase [Planctomycetales bacterium]MCB9925151.1 metallophosphoesterase [Planctomycetaceae bacterium]
MYDLIGDIHGHADALSALLRELGYQDSGGTFRHPGRQAVFVGDFVDRGPKIRETLHIVRAMVESGSAVAVMGNHEFNAIAYHTSDPQSPKDFLRPHSEKNNRQHHATLTQLRDSELAEYLEWFKKLPVTLELDGVRVVHACWDREGIDCIESSLDKYGRFTPEFMREATDQHSRLFRAIEDVLKGPEIALPEGIAVCDKEGTPRRKMRVRWYESPVGKNYSEYALSAEAGFPNHPLPESARLAARIYSPDAPPVFVGHYWLRGTPKPLAANVACLDYSVAKGGRLCAYRWRGESTLDASHFVLAAVSNAQRV